MILLVVLFLVIGWTSTGSFTVMLVMGVVLLSIPLAGVAARTYRGRPEALTDEKDIAGHLEALRKDASDFFAVWSGEYPEVEVERYFEAEKKALETNESLKISRVINPTVIPDKHYNLLQAMRQEFGSRFELYEDASIHFFELFVAEYPNKDPVAVVVVNDIVKKRPKVGLVLDPGRNPRLVGAVGAVRAWFETIRGGLREFERPAIERWDHLAPRYTEFVSKNVKKIPFLDAYTLDEGKLISGYLGSVMEAGLDLSIVEIGCGDGRALLRYLPASFSNGVSYIIGLDYAPAMLQAAETALASHLSTAGMSISVRELAEKTGFYRLNAFDMRRIFDDGHLRDPAQLEKASFASAPPALDAAIFADSRKIFLCLLNTIGVVEPLTRRKEMVETMLAALGRDDRLILTVFAADSFEAKAQELYQGLEPMLRMKVEEAHFEFPTATFHIDGIPGYYSHWFEEAELRELLGGAAMSLGSLGRAFDPPMITRMNSDGYFVEMRRTG